MACPLITGKGYSFSDPVIERGTVGASVRAAVEFTIFPQEGYFLRAEHFYVNSSSDFISQVQFIQNGNNVNVIATLDVDTWPGENTALDLDIEYLYIEPFGLDPIVRVQTINILPINDANITTMLEDGTVVPPEGVEITITGMCGETVDLPVINVSPGPGLLILQGEDSIEVEASDPDVNITASTDDDGELELDSTYTFDENDTEALTDEDGNLVDENGDPVDEEDAIPVDATGTEITIEGVDIMLGIPFSDIVNEDLINPDDSEIGLRIDHDDQASTSGGPTLVSIFGIPFAEVSYSVTSDCQDPFTNDEVVSELDEDGCPVSTTITNPVSGTVTLDTNGNGEFTFTIPTHDETGAGEGECCTYTITVNDDVNPEVTGEIVQCDDLVTLTICIATRDDQVFPDTDEVIITFTQAPGTPVQFIREDYTRQPVTNGAWILDLPIVDPLNPECWIDENDDPNGPHPTDVFECVKLDAVIDDIDLVLDFSFTDGTMPDVNTILKLNLDCFAEDPLVDLTESSVEFCVDLGDSPSQVSVSGPQRITGTQGTIIPQFRFTFDITLEDGYIWSEPISDVNIGGPTVFPVHIPNANEVFGDVDTFTLTNVNSQVRRFTFETITTSTYTTTSTFELTVNKVTYTIPMGAELYVPPVEVVEIPGCTDSTATNYNPDATQDDGSCEYPVAPPPQFSCTVNIINNVPNTAFADGIEATQVFGPHNTGTTFDGMFDIESVDGYDALDFSTVAVVQDPVQLTINGTSFFGIQTVGDSEITITLDGDGPTETVVVPPLEPLACPLDNLESDDITVEADGTLTLTGSLNEGDFLSFIPESIPIDGNSHRVNYRMEVPAGYSNTGDVLECGGPLIQTELPTGDVPACVRLYDLISGDLLDPNGLIKLYHSVDADGNDINDATVDTIENFRVDVDNITLERTSNIENYYLLGVLDNDSHFGTISGSGSSGGQSTSTDLYVQDAEDESGNQINNGKQNLPANFFTGRFGPNFARLDGIFSTGFAVSGTVISLRWQQLNTETASKVYLDLDLNVTALAPIPGEAKIKFNFIKNGVFTPIEWESGSGDIFDGTLELTGLSGQQVPDEQFRVLFGILNTEENYYGPGQWQENMLDTLEAQYYLDQGYIVTTATSAGVSSFSQYTPLRIDFVPEDSDFTTDPYPNIGKRLIIDETARTITEIPASSLPYYLFRAFPREGFLGNPFGTGGYSDIVRCDGISQAFLVYGDGAPGLFDPRGGCATYNVYIDVPTPPEPQQNGTILYTDESSEYMGTTPISVADNSVVSIESYDWGQQVIGTALDEQSFTFTTNRGYPAITNNHNFGFSLVEREYRDECQDFLGVIDAAESSMSITDTFADNIDMYGNRGQIDITVAGQPGDVQLTNRDVVLDLDITGELEPLEEATFEVILIDNFRNSTVTEADTYSGFETEWFPENTPFVVGAVPSTGYSFQEDTVTGITILTQDVTLDQRTIEASNGPNLGIFDNGDIMFDTTTIPGQLLVQVQPGAMQELASGHTVIRLLAEGIPTGPPFDEDTEFDAQARFFASDDLINHTVTADPAVDVSTPNTVDITRFNTADENSENNTPYTVTITPQDGESYNPLNLNEGDIDVYSEFDRSVEFTDYIITNVRLGDDGKSVVFDWDFTFTSIPSENPIDIYFDLPDPALNSDEFVQVEFVATENVATASLRGDTTVLHGGLRRGDTVSATFTIRPDLYFNLESVGNLQSVITEPDYTDSPVRLSTNTTSFVRGLFTGGRELEFTLTYTVSTDDFSSLIDGDPADRTHRISIALTDAEIITEAVVASLTIRSTDHSRAVSSSDVISVSQNAGTTLDAISDFAPTWTLPNNSFHWYREGIPITDIMRIRHISGENFIPVADRTLSSAPTEGTGASSYKIMVGDFDMSTSVVLPEGDHVYELYIEGEPADDTIRRLICTPSESVVPFTGGDYTFCIENETGSNINLNQCGIVGFHPMASSQNALPIAVDPNDGRCFTTTIPATTTTDEDDSLTWRIIAESEFTSTADKELEQDVRPREEQDSMTDFHIEYDVSGLPDNIQPILDSGFVDMGSGIWRYTRRDWPGRLGDNEIQFIWLATGIDLRATDNFLIWSNAPEASGNLTFTAPNESRNINGRKRWGIPNTAGRFGIPAFRGELRQDSFDAPISDGVTVQNTLTYDYHPRVDTTVRIVVTGMLSETLPSFDCDSTITYIQPGAPRDMSSVLIPFDVSESFSDDGSLNTSNGDVWVSTLSQGRVQFDQNYRIQLIYGQPTNTGALTDMGIFTDSGWISVFFANSDTPYQYNGIHTSFGQELWDIPGWYGYQFGTANIDSYILRGNSNVGSPIPISFNPNFMAGSRPGFQLAHPTYPNDNDGAITHQVGVGNFVNIQSVSAQFGSGFNLTKAVNWWNTISSDEPPQVFYARVLTGVAESSVNGQNEPYPMDIRLQGSCIAGTEFDPPFTTNDAVSDQTEPLSRGDTIWTLDQDTTFL